VKAPQPVCVDCILGIPARVLLGSAKFGWLKRLKNSDSKRHFTRSVMGNLFVT
jgi:hypothetical protein